MPWRPVPRTADTRVITDYRQEAAWMHEAMADGKELLVETLGNDYCISFE
jgi:hypothetical protein